jgi:hypothetical protein
MVSLLFIAILLPLVLVMFTVTIEFSNFFGVRDELQRVVDREAHDALVRGRTAQQVERFLRTRLSNLAGMANVTEVTMDRAPAQVRLSATAEFQGPFFQFIQRFTGREETVMAMRLDSQVRILPAATLIVFDRGVIDAAAECSDPKLQAIASFVDRLADTWSAVGNAEVTVAVTPGDGEPLRQISPLADDFLPRCRGRSAGPLVDASAIRGSAAPVGYSAYSFGLEVVELASTTVLNRSVFKRAIVLVVDKNRYDLSYSSMLFSLLREATQGSGVSVDLYTAAVVDANTFDLRPVESGINGGVFREVGVLTSQLNGTGLLSALTRSVTDYVVLER